MLRRIHVCFATDDGYAPYCGVAIASIIKNANQDDFLHVHILDGGIKSDNKQKLAGLAVQGKLTIDFIELDYEEFKQFPIVSDVHISSATYFRLRIPSLIKDSDRVIYLDCDLIVNASLWELYDCNMEDCFVGMVPAYTEQASKYRLGTDRYYNAGVLLIDAKKWRDEDAEKSLFRYLSESGCTLKSNDQDLLNIVFKGKILTLEGKWNLQFTIEEDYYKKAELEYKKASIIHFLSPIKPWHPIARPLTVEIYKRYAKEVAWNIFLQTEMERSRLSMYLFDNINQVIYMRFLEFVYNLEKQGVLGKRESFMLSQGEHWKELRLALAEKKVEVSVTSLQEYLEMPDKSKMILLVPDSFDYEIYGKLKQEGLEDLKDYYFETDSSCYAAIKLLLEELTLGRLKDCKKIALYGTAVMAKRFTRVLYNLGLEIPFYISSFEEEKTFLGKDVFLPEQIKEHYREFDKIIIASAAYGAIIQKLNSLSLNEESEFICIYI